MVSEAKPTSAARDWALELAGWHNQAVDMLVRRNRECREAVEAGVPVNELARELGTSDGVLTRWLAGSTSRLGRLHVQ